MPDDSQGLTAFPPAPWAMAIDALATRGHAQLPAALPPACWRALHAEAVTLHGGAGFRPARVGRAGGLQRERAVRGDELCWLTPTMNAGGRYLAWMDALREALNRELFLGLAEFEAQYAHYPAGAFYKRHVDRHRDANARVISTVIYLNPDWPDEAGGELVLYGDDGAELFRQMPVGGTLVLFRSEDMPHEVLPAAQERWSIAGWFRTRG